MASYKCFLQFAVSLPHPHEPELEHEMSEMSHQLPQFCRTIRKAAHSYGSGCLSAFQSEWPSIINNII